MKLLNNLASIFFSRSHFFSITVEAKIDNGKWKKSKILIEN